MEDEAIDEAETWSVIRYLDPDEFEAGQETTSATTITIVAILVICSGAWVLFRLRLKRRW
jgi:hypothetical protein